MSKRLIDYLLKIAFALLIANTNALAATCTVVATGVVFGNYDSSNYLDGTGNIAVTCVALVIGSVSYTIALSAGSGSFSTRQLKFGNYTLNYNAYTSNTRSVIWGDGTSSTSTVGDSYGILLVPVLRNYTVFARIPANQNPYVGTYTDTLDVTVTY